MIPMGDPFSRMDSEWRLPGSPNYNQPAKAVTGSDQSRGCQIIGCPQPVKVGMDICQFHFENGEAIEELEMRAHG